MKKEIKRKEKIKKNRIDILDTMDIVSSASIKKSKDENNVLVLAPSELDYKAKKCQRCFYLEKNKKIATKAFPPPVFSRFDVVY